MPCIYLSLLPCFVVAALSVAPTSVLADQPNVLMFLVDDLKLLAKHPEAVARRQ